MRKKLFYLSIILVYTITFLGCSIGTNKIKDEGITSLKEKNYNNALIKFNEVLNKDSQNTDAIALKELAENCISLVDKYNNNEFSSVIEAYDKIKINPNFNLVNVDIDNIYNDAKKKPNLKLRYVVYDSKEFHKSSYFEDEKGEILLASDTKSELQDGAFIINTTRPLTEALFEIENIGIDPAEDVVLNLEFNHMAIEFTPGHPKWMGVSNIHGLGLWNEIKFIENDGPLYKDIPIKFKFSFARSLVHPNANIEVTLLAKNCTPKKFKIPVKVKDTSHDLK